MGRGAQTEERVRFVYGFMRRSKSSTGMRRAHLFSGASGGRRSASAAVDGATAIPHLNEDTFAIFDAFSGDAPLHSWNFGLAVSYLEGEPESSKNQAPGSYLG